MACKRCCTIQQRYMLCCVSSILVISGFLTRSALGVLIVAMVNKTNTNPLFGNFSNTFHRSLNSEAPVLKWSRGMQGVILSSPFWGYATCQVISGIVAQQLGGKWVVACGVFISAILDFLTPILATVSPYLMLIVTGVKGVMTSSILPGTYAILGLWIPLQETDLMSFVGQIVVISQLISNAYAGPLCDSQLGWPSVFYLNGGLALLSLIPWCIFVYRSPNNHPFISTEEKELINQSLKSNQDADKKHGIPWRIFCSLTILSYCIFSFGVGSIYSMLQFCIPRYLDDVLHLSISHNSLYLSLSSISGTIVFILTAQISNYVFSREWLSRTIYRKLLVGIGNFSVTVVYLAFALFKCNALAAIFLMNGISCGFTVSSLIFCSGPLDLSQNYSGIVYGMGNSFYTVANIVTPIIIYTVTRGRSLEEWNAVFFFMSAVVAGSSLFYIAFGSAERQPWDNDRSNIETHQIGHTEDEALLTK